jgi:hypothetical protein
MRTRWTTTFATLAVLAACAQSEPNDSARPAPGGNAPDIAAGDEGPVDASPPRADAGDGANVCVSSSPECCPPPEFAGCETLDEFACGETVYCLSIVGYRILPPGSDAGNPSGTFLACHPTCIGYENKPLGVAYDPADPSTCYSFNPPVFPEGWIEVDYSSGIPPGMCGT